MWFNERYTLSRGRWEVPRIFLRIRSCTCRRFAFFDDCVSIASVLGHITREIPRCARDYASRARASACSGATEQSEVVEWSRLKSSFRSRFSNLLLQSLARVADTFVLVRIRWTQSAHLHQVPVLLLHADAAGQLRVQLAFWALHGNRVAFDFYRHPFGERDRLSSNSRHKLSALSYQLSTWPASPSFLKADG